MRRGQIVALCLMVGALIAAAITPGVVAGPKTAVKVEPPPLRPGFTLDRRVRFADGSVLTFSHKFRPIGPGEKGYVPPKGKR